MGNLNEEVGLKDDAALASLEEDPEEEEINHGLEGDSEDLSCEEGPVEEVEDRQEEFYHSLEDDPEEESGKEDTSGKEVETNRHSVGDISCKASDGEHEKHLLVNCNHEDNVPSCSIEKKRSCDATSVNSAIQSQKKRRSGEVAESERRLDSAASDPYCNTGLSKASDNRGVSDKDGTGSSGKRRRSRWEPQHDGDQENVRDDMSNKKRKTRWSSYDMQTKMLGPLQLPDFIKETALESDSDPEIIELKAELAEVNSELQKPVLQGLGPAEEQSPCLEPLHSNLGIGTDMHEVRVREKLIQRRQSLISKLIFKHPTFKPPLGSKTSKLAKKLYVPLEQYPGYNFIGLILGPQGNTQKRLEKETGARISVRGAGSSTWGKHACDDDELHVLIEAENKESLKAAVRMVEKLLIPVDESVNDHRRAQLKELATLKKICPEAKSRCCICSTAHLNHVCPHQPHTSTAVSGNTHDTKNSPCLSTSAGRASFSHDKANLYVGHLPKTVDEVRLRELFCPFGQLAGAKVIRDHDTKLSKGYGFVRFEKASDAAVAVSRLNGFKTGNKILAVKVAGHTKASESPSLNVLSQTAWPGPPGSLLLEPRMHSIESPVAWPGPPGSLLVELPATLPMSGAHINCSTPGFLPDDITYTSQDLTFTPPYDAAGLPNCDGTRSFPSSYSFSDQNPILSPHSMSNFAGDADCPYSSSFFTSYHGNPEDFQTPENHVKPVNWPSTHHAP